MSYLREALLLILLCFALLGKSQVVNIARLSSDSGYWFINKNSEVLQASSLISLDSVLSPSAQQKFEPLKNDKVLFKGYDPYYYWYRFTLYNSDTIAHDFVLLLGGLGIRNVEIWKNYSGLWTSLGKSGYRYPFSKRPYPFAHHAFPVSLSPHDTSTFYIRIDESHAYKSIAFVLAEPHKLRLFEHRFYFLFGIITGLLFLFFIFNLYLYFSIREKIHLWYALYIITILFFLIKNEGLGAEFLGLDSIAGYRSTYMGAVATLAVGFLLVVVQTFLINIKNARWLYKLMSFLKWSAFFTAAAEFIIFYYQPDYTIEFFLFEWANKTGLLSLFVIIIACCYSFYKGFKPALFILTGQFLFIVGIAARGLFIGAEAYMFPPSLFEIGLVAEVVIISYGLMYRYNQYKVEKEVLKERLEWQQIQTARQMVQVQEAEQKRIAQDLHDELGGNLAALKMTLNSFSLPDERAGVLIGLIDSASASARSIAHNLMPPEFETTLLDNLLAGHCQRLSTENNLQFHFHSTGKKTYFSKQDELMIYRIAMELASNILKHSKATEATLQLIYHENYLEIMSEDNGKGFPSTPSDGIGLANIRSRVNFLNGTMNIDSGAYGTTTIIQIPYKQIA
jgi:signal transduction histidine kinase